MQIEDDGQIEPSFLRPDIADVTGPFPVRAVCADVPVQQVRRNIEAVVAIRGRLKLLVSLHHNAVLTHQTANPAMANIKAKFLQLFGHSGSAKAT